MTLKGKLERERTQSHPQRNRAPREKEVKRVDLLVNVSPRRNQEKKGMIPLILTARQRTVRKVC